MGAAESQQVEVRLRRARLDDVYLPRRFNLYHTGMSGTKTVLGESESNPCCLIKMSCGWHGKLIMYNGPTSEAAPVAMIRNIGTLWSHDKIQLPAPRPGLQPWREDLRCQRNGWSTSYVFVAKVGTGSLPEKFE